MLRWFKNLFDKKEESPDPEQWDDPMARTINRAWQTGEAIYWTKDDPLPDIPDKSKWIPLDEEAREFHHPEQGR